ncbi:MAG: type VI secretion system contractile sheath large subunit [Pyrinomonadaceae bacterium]
MNPGGSNLEAEFSMERAAVEVPEDPPFHILVLGDFSNASGRFGQSGEVRGALKPFEVDRDEFADYIKRVSPVVEIGDAEAGYFPVNVSSLEDFHPDSLFRDVALFEDLRELRRRLGNDSEYHRAARDVRELFGADAGSGTNGVEVESSGVASVGGGSGSAAALTPSISEGEVESAGLLEDILGDRNRDAAAYHVEEASGSKSAMSLPLKDLVSKVVEPFVVKHDEDEKQRLMGAIDESVSGLMRMILHDRRFMEQEALWRGLYFLLRRVETSLALRIFVLDISKDRLLADLKGEEGEKLQDLLAYGCDANGNQPWGVVLGGYEFSPEVDDVAALMRVSQISSVSNSPFVSYMRPSMFGFENFGGKEDLKSWDVESDTPEARLWTALRSSDEAALLGMCAPRLMGRLPYGKDSEPLETFDFEEFDGSGIAAGEHEKFVWMNPAFAVGLALAMSFVSQGWDIGGRYALDVTGLPVYQFEENGETKTVPGAEMEMSDVALAKLLEEGIMPMASFRGTDRVRIGGIQSVKFPVCALKGRWG